MSRNLTVVIKPSKFCNLRCRYCYEYDFLNDTLRMSVEQIVVMFNTLSEIERRLDARMKFCWHGGEPLLLGYDFFENALGAQEKAFSSSRTHIIQTNLNRLTPRDIDSLRLFSFVSISFDVMGNARVLANGQTSTYRVLANMDKLRNNSIKFGAICVLTRETLGDVDTVFNFYNESSTSFRLLPYYRSSSDLQESTFGLSASEVRDSLIDLQEQWFTRSNNINVYPIEDFVQIATHYVSGQDGGYRFNKYDMEHVLIIEPDGGVFASGTAGQTKYRYGNIFSNSAKEILNSHQRMAASARSESLQKAVCYSCQFFGHCSGFPVAEQTDVELKANNTESLCPVWFDLIEKAVDRVGLVKKESVGAVSNNVKLRDRL